MIRDAIQAELERGEKSVPDLVKSIGATRKAIENSLRELEKAGLAKREKIVTHPRVGRYVIRARTPKVIWGRA